MMTSYIKETLLLCLIMCTALFAGCSDDKDEVTPLPEGQGEVTFKFVRNEVYTVSSLEEMARLKVTLEKDGKKIVLPTVDLTGDAESLITPTVRLDNGTYKVIKYIAYNSKGTQVQEAYLDEENTLTVEHGQISTFFFPISIRIIYVNNQLRNMLFGVCTEVLGADSTKWPKSWRVENEDLMTWENLEFELDDNDNILYLANIIFDEKFAGMKKLPAAVSLFPTLEGIQIINLPEFEELPENLHESNISTISLINTGLKSFPKNFEGMKNLYSITVRNSQLTEIPARLAKLDKLLYVSLSGNQITEFPSELADKWQSLETLAMTNTKLSSLPSNLFKMKRVVTFDFANNPNLSTLPDSKEGVITHLGNLFLDHCGFTSIPKIAKQRLLGLTLSYNKITTVTEEELNGLNNQLTWLNLDGNKIRNFPKMQSGSLLGLSLNDCGLSVIPDLSGLPSLCILSVAKNNIAAVADGAFTKNERLSILDLSDNTSLTSISADAGFKLIPQVDVLPDHTEVTVAKPYYLGSVNVDNCPNLVWKIPGTWCCIKNINVGSKDDIELPRRAVVVYNRNSPKVTRDACPVCGRSVYEIPKSFDEQLQEAKERFSK